MATPTPTHINSTAPRKLPIKRKSPHQPQPQSQVQIQPPNPNPNPNFPYPSEEDYEFDDDDEDESPNPNPNPNSNSNPRAPPFKFHRIWSEPDEIRFLQGLLGCYSQGLVFPRDLNLFYDRFSESMPQPYTRSQLSEKLRRLRKKYRIMSGRIARGQDPSRLAPHDRDLLHLCTRLWHPDHASTSPFSPAAAGPASGSSNGNKRRRANPRAPVVLSAATEDLETEDETVAPLAIVPPTETNTVTADISGSNGSEGGNKGETDAKVDYFAAKTVLDAFDKSLEEVRMGLAQRGGSGVGDDELARKWREQRIEELDVFARRLRLVLEPSPC